MIGMAATLNPARSLRGGALLDLDWWTLFAALALLGLGLVMVTSASLPIASNPAKFSSPFYYVTRHLIAIFIGLALGGLVLATPMDWWARRGNLLYFTGVLLLILVLVPGVGRQVNGAIRWIPLGVFNLQGSEYMKLFAVIYMAGYLVRRGHEVSTRVLGVIKPLILISLACLLILAEPDFGTTAVILATVLGLLFLGGAPLWQFGLLLGLVALLFVGLVLFEPYRVARLTAFLNPWEDRLGSGYQLSQALIAFGRGEWFGVGLGNGIQKQYYLPEAHTDFILAVIGEELGLIGTFLVVTLFAFICYRAFRIGGVAERAGRRFSGYVAYGLGLWLGLQTFINVGVNVGLLPTKGLTLPFMSYGGNSVIMSCLAAAVLLRIDYENHQRVPPSETKEKAPWDPS
jgi:cell division protein FtsW